MLLELRAENYAVIDHAVAVFGPGLNLLTGETGAGKSILIDALALLLGGKGSADVVRHGAEKAVVSCVFESTPGAEAILESNGIDPADGEILLRRELALNGKGRVFINNQPATVGTLRQLAPELALVHAQSETLSTFDQAQQRGLLDRFGSIATDAVAAAYATWQATKDKLEALEHDEQDRLRMADLWSFQKREIEQAHLTAEDEDIVLETEKRVLANAEKLYAAAMGAHDFLYESESSAETALLAGLKQLEELARYDAKFEEAVQQLTAARATVQDISATVRDYAEGINASPERLAEIEDRLALLDRMKRKYGQTLSEVIAYGAEVAAKLAEIENRDQILADLRHQMEKHAEAYRTAAKMLTDQRSAAAKRLETLAEAQINDLAMRVQFAVQVVAQQDAAFWSAHGWDHVEYRIATNAGEPLKPLDEIASGGEMSRVMLALKVSVEEGANAGAKGRKKTVLPRTLVFDEIDIGIGGRAAEAVGQKLKALSRAQQVLCITHLPQIAAFADQHFLIEKSEKSGRTRTTVRLMSEVERTEEIARMLSGATLTDTSMKHAEQMLKTSR
ncbi:MAG: DNA repair protein RecN [Acidobacteriaceae bacterium]